MEEYKSSTEYLKDLKKRAKLPAGFKAGTASLSFYPTELETPKAYKMNLSLILLDKPTVSFHAVFTKNLICGFPIIIGKKRLKEKSCLGILANNKISNVAAPGGLADAEEILKNLASQLGTTSNKFFPASTGIIGWRLPKKEILKTIPELIQNLQEESLLPVAEAIMTTDSYPKIRARYLEGGSIVACAKGAGMIEPSLGTLLVFILTDLGVTREFLAKCLQESVKETLNCISIDGDQSTSDLAIILSSNKKPLSKQNLFSKALTEILSELSDDIVRNGEGVSHVIQVRVKGAQSFETARQAGKAIINSPLVKTSIFGNEPNVGRIIAALGSFMGKEGLNIKKEDLQVKIGGRAIFAHNQFLLNPKTEEELTNYLKDTAYSLKNKYPPHKKSVEIEILLGKGKGEALVRGADLTYDYIKGNTAYRS